LHFASGAAQALELLANRPVDVVVTDMCMPDIDGAELLRRVRHRYPDTVRIVLSGQFSKNAGLQAVAVAHQFLLKPSEPQLLRAAVDQSLAVRRMLTPDQVRRAAGAVGALPFCARTHAALLEVLERPDVSMEAVAEVVERDPAVAAKILHVANSAFLGRTQPVSSMLSAVQMLGMENLRELVLSAEILSCFEASPDGQFPLADLFLHPRLAARIAGWLPAPEALRPQNVVTALLHDIGKLVVACQLPEPYRRMAKAVAEGADWIAAEQAALGATHAEIGAYLLGLWGLPRPIVEAVLEHHSDPGPPDAWTVAETVRIANALARSPGAPPSPLLDPLRLQHLADPAEIDRWRRRAERDGRELSPPA
jgi:HD-like signal output (HDOD) protein